jgi:hypothetical protein
MADRCQGVCAGENLVARLEFGGTGSVGGRKDDRVAPSLGALRITEATHTAIS